MTNSSLARQCAAELAGTFILVFFGVGAVHAAVLTGAQSGLWQVAVVWAVAISLAIYAVGAISGAHINPAITIASAAVGKFPMRRIGPYVLAQLAGAILAAGVLFALFGGVLRQFEAAEGIVRGQRGSELSAMVYGEYFPNPAVAKARGWSADSVSEARAMLAEGIGTAFLAFFVFAVTDRRNRSGPGGRLFPLLIGLAVAIIISVVAPLTQAGLNPARDFGPRLFAFFAGWGSVAIPGPRGGFLTVYVLSPIVGALAGAGAWQLIVAGGPASTAQGQRPGSAEGSRTVQPVQLILVGGFLGAGKTTLLWQAAGRLMARGKRVGLITNDQAPDLVDTGLLVGRGLDVGEVSGSCFCCNFPGLVEAARTLKGDMHADVLIAEPVGSCTDLSATILQPLKHSYRNEFALSPLTVLADPMRLKHVLAGQAGPLHPSAAYILLKQLEEADVIVVNKAELLSPNETAELSAALAKAFPGVEVRFLSALTGQGIDDWLDWALAGGQAGQRIAQVDYDTYAEGEAALGWLNAHVAVSRRDEKADWRAFCREMMESLKAEFARRLANVGHVKMLLSTPQGHYACNLTRTDGDIAVGGDIQGSPRQAEMIVNARVEIEPQELEGIVRGSLQAASRLCFDATVSSLRSLRPGRPAPTHRYAAPL